MGVFGKMVHWVRHFWLFIFNYSIPVILNEKLRPLRLVLSLIFSVPVLILAYGGTSFLNSS
jgi:hypothetical protein